MIRNAPADRIRPLVRSALVALLALAARAPAQQPADGIVVELAWTEFRSLALFEACDRDADDRLDVFEISRALLDLGGSRDPAVIRRLDLDQSGFLEWPEFDARFRMSIERAKQFRVRTVRPVADNPDPSAPPSPRNPAQIVIGMLDENGDGVLSRTELATFLRRLRQDPALVEQFPVLDRDGSGGLDAGEFGPIAAMVPDIEGVLGANRTLRAELPPEFQAADRNLDGLVDRVELRLALLRLHPTLERWADRVFAAVDKTRNGTLGAAELRAGTATAREALATPR